MTPDTFPMSSLGNWDDGGASVQIEEERAMPSLALRPALAPYGLSLLRSLRAFARSSLSRGRG